MLLGLELEGEIYSFFVTMQEFRFYEVFIYVFLSPIGIHFCSVLAFLKTPTLNEPFRHYHFSGSGGRQDHYLDTTSGTTFLSGVTLLKCSVACLNSKPNCRAFNYIKKHKNCALLTATVCEPSKRKEQLQPFKGAKYFETISSLEVSVCFYFQNQSSHCHQFQNPILCDGFRIG